MKALSKNKLYWICQLGGWFIFIGMELSNYVRLDGFQWPLLTNAFVNLVLGISITHLYRLFVIRKGWLNLPLTQLIPRAMVTVVIMVSLLTFVNIPLDRITYPFFREVEITLGFFLGYFFNLSKFVLLWTLTYHLFQYWERSLLVEKEKYQLQAAVKENAYQNLKNQLNPHFLFNSLNSIRTLVDADPKLAKSAITQLSGLLRSSLNTGNKKTVTLHDELETVKHYLAIESIRFDERLRCRFLIADDTLDVQVPPMMLQTLVENAVKHGISKSKQGGEITLQTLRTGTHLLITLTNTGQYEPNPSHEGVGIENTRKRLHILYDDAATFSIGNANAHEVKTEITIPL